MRADWGRPEPSFRVTSPASSIFFNSFLTPFKFHSYSGWLSAILVDPYLYFIGRYLITFYSHGMRKYGMRTPYHLLLTIWFKMKRKTDLQTSWCQLISIIWDKVFKSGPSKICGRQTLKNLKPSNFLKTVFRKFYLVHSWILCPIYDRVFRRHSIEARLYQFKLTFMTEVPII